MSKVTSTSANYPSYSNSSISVGDSTAKTGLTNGGVTSSYNMSGNQADIYNYALSTLASILPQLNTFDSNTRNSIQSQIDAYKNSGIADINETYNPMITSLENDISSRFGNLDNSMFSDNLSKIESERSKAVSSFAQDVLSKQSSLESDELTKRYALAEFLNGIANSTYDNALKALSTALNGSSSANNYNNDLYKALSAVKSTNSSNNNSLVSSLLGLSGNSGLSSLFSSFL